MSLHDQIESKLVGSNIYGKKKTWQTVTSDKDNCTFSVVHNLLKIKSKAYNLLKYNKAYLNL